jgi:hypothetical protein
MSDAKQWHHIGKKLLVQLRAYELDYLQSQLTPTEPSTFRQLRNLIMSQIRSHNFKIEILFPPLNMLQLFVGHSIVDDFATQLPESFQLALLHIYSANNIRNITPWPSLGQLQRCSVPELRTFFRLHQFAIDPELYSKRSYIKKFRSLMGDLGHHISTADVKPPIYVELPIFYEDG